MWNSLASPHEVQNHELVPFHVTIIIGIRLCEAGERCVQIAVPGVKPGEKNEIRGRDLMTLSVIRRAVRIEQLGFHWMHFYEIWY